MPLVDILFSISTLFGCILPSPGPNSHCSASMIHDDACHEACPMTGKILQTDKSGCDPNKIIITNCQT